MAKANTSRRLDLRRFMPMTPQASATVRHFMSAGAILLSVDRDAVRLRRLDSVASVDAWGRVVWTAAPTNAAR